MQCWRFVHEWFNKCNEKIASCDHATNSLKILCSASCSGNRSTMRKMSTTIPSRQAMIDTTVDSDTMEIHKDLDARGLNCPLPILKAKKALADMETGQVLRIVATDTGS